MVFPDETCFVGYTAFPVIDPATGKKPGSWIVTDKSGKAVRELYSEEAARAINREKYDVMPKGQYLGDYNRRVKEAGGVEPPAVRTDVGPIVLFGVGLVGVELIRPLADARAGDDLEARGGGDARGAYGAVPAARAQPDLVCEWAARLLMPELGGSLVRVRVSGQG